MRRLWCSTHHDGSWLYRARIPRVPVVSRSWHSCLSSRHRRQIPTIQHLSKRHAYNKMKVSVTMLDDMMLVITFVSSSGDRR